MTVALGAVVVAFALSLWARGPSGPRAPVPASPTTLSRSGEIVSIERRTPLPRGALRLEVTVRVWRLGAASYLAHGDLEAPPGQSPAVGDRVELRVDADNPMRIRISRAFATPLR